MDSPKIEALEIIQNMKDDVTWDKLAYTFYVRASVERGIKDIEEGRGIPHEVVMKEMDEWVDSLEKQAIKTISA